MQAFSINLARNCVVTARFRTKISTQALHIYVFCYTSICFSFLEQLNFIVQDKDYIHPVHQGCSILHFNTIVLLIKKIVQAKGYRVGPVYDDVLAMAWFFLELIVKSMALEKSRLFYHSLSTGIFKFQETYSCHPLCFLFLISMFLHWDLLEYIY